MPGTVSVRPLSAKLTRDTELFGTMDPYCKILLGKQKVNGQVCKNGGKHPTWDETLVLKRASEPNFRLELMEHDWLLPDGIIGECSVSLNEVENKQRVLKWYPLTYTGKPVGQILLEINYDEERKQAPKFEVPPGFTEVKKEDKFEVPSGFTLVNDQNKIHQINPSNVHGYNPHMNQYNNNNNNSFNNQYTNPFNNDYQYQQHQQNNFYNQNNQQDVFAPPAHENTEGYTQKYPTFESQHYGSNDFHNQAAHGQETIDYRNQQQTSFNNQQQLTGFNNQQHYPGVTNEPLTPTHQHDQDTGSTNTWDPIRAIRGVINRK